MRTPKFTAKRAIGLAAAAALAVAGTVTFASSSQAAAQSLKLSYSTGGETAGRILSVTGKGFENAAGVNQVGKVFFSATACTNTPTADLVLAADINHVSATNITLKTPALTGSVGGKALFLCVNNKADTEVLGTAKYTVYLAPVDNTTTPLSVTSGPTWGGTTLTVTGENFTPKTKVLVGGKELTKTKVVIGSGRVVDGTAGDDTITGTLPVSTAGAKDVVVQTEGGKDTEVGAFTVVGALKVSPDNLGLGVTRAITVTGSDFDSKSFVDAWAANKSVVVLARAGVTAALADTAAPANSLPCVAVQVVDDTTLTCKVTTLAADAGAYTVQVIDAGATTNSAFTGVSKDATVSVSAF
ncbi:IPT/TIG domain-containing protein [Kineosporia succinea]|uniref:IPT/TIG domain-containing protein n=1 Tax=Kineosporia succinea TaxID=84632 RepID=A0ABT9P1M5_9ACTN|nr:IPT/TIG domain-containing protein [Kineosporia succinea]MDP9826573.1 hypothetical protein [Kineosporia succinea]